MIEGMEKGELSNDQATKSAQFVLDRLELVQSTDELNVFLEELSTKWEVYRQAYLKAKEKELVREEEEKLRTVKDRLSKLVTSK